MQLCIKIESPLIPRSPCPIVPRSPLLLVLFLLVTLAAHPEGTRQIMPGAELKGQLCIDYYRNDFAFYDGAEAFRLNIAIGGVAEVIRFGFGDVAGNYTDDLEFRIKDPLGNVVFGPLAIPTSGQGYIESWDEAAAGPFPAVGGYDYFEIPAAHTGNYYIEFFYPPYSNGTYDHNNQHMLDYFDITVVDAAGEAKNGRLWSEAWQFWSENPDAPPTTDRFYGKMFVLSDDSIVTKVDCNGLIGGTFSYSSNMTGCASTGNFMEDRKSRTGFYTYPQYKVFLNDPDSVLFPTARLQSGLIEPVTISTDCATGQVQFGIQVVKDGTVELLVEVNPNTGADPEDVQIVAAVLADPGGSGYNIITWNGNDNYGNPVPNGSSLILDVSFLSGLTQLPIYDIEYHDRGFIVEQVRPPGGYMDIYWDDTSLGGSYDTVNGCYSYGGCHTWSNEMGDDNTINTWWYVVSQQITPIVFELPRQPAEPVLTGDSIWCIGSGSLTYIIEPEPNSTEYLWSYSGSGVSISGSGTTVTLDFSASATAGTLSVKGVNEDCGEGPAAAIELLFVPLPVVTLAAFDDVCFTAPGYPLTGGSPDGGTYFVDGQQTDSLFPYLMDEGLHQVVYSYLDDFGCSNADTSSVLLYNGPDCEGVIYFPNAFTPNGDGLNDRFRPKELNVVRFSLLIYNRWGEKLFETHDPLEGWDGTFRGTQCPAGIYVYSSTYGLSLRTDDNGKKDGVVMLIR